MKHLKTRLTILLCVLSIMLLCLGLAACGGKTYKVTLDYNAEQGEVTLSPEAENNEYEDGTELTVTVAPETGYEIETFTVSTDANAKLTDGKYKLTVSADTTIKVTFKTTEIAVSGITLTPDTLELEVGGRTEDATATLVATVEPADATDKTVTWTSSDPTVATVEGGNVTALAEGETTITATAGGKSATCVVTVTQHVHKAAEGAEWKQDTENNQHYKECVCGEHVEVGAHAAKDDTYYQDEENNKHYQLCVCGARVNESEHNLKINAEKTKFECEQCDYEEAHTHDTQLQDTGANGHKTVCKTEGCGYESAVTAHSAKDETYQKDEENNKHYQLCECGARVNEAAHSAVEGAEWKQDAANHYKECVCGEHVEVTAHSAKDDTYYQDEENNKHYQLCECGARVNESEHTAKDSKWLHDDGDEETGKHYQLCVCGEKVNESAHDIDPEAYSDGTTGHHFECTVCDYKTAVAAHEQGSSEVKSKNATQHSYRCGVCNEEVLEDHELTDWDFSDPTYEFLNCTKCEYHNGYTHNLTTVSDENGEHHTECSNSYKSGAKCTYKTESVSCNMQWSRLENEEEGHKGNCPTCGYTVDSEEHDNSGPDGACSKCGYKKTEEHICKDEPVNEYYDGLCNVCGKIVNNIWEFQDGKITKYNGTYTKVKVPSSIEGNAVTTFSGDTGACFRGNTTLTAIIIPESVTTLPSYGLYGCTNLTTAIILAQADTMPMNFFTSCKNLSLLVLPATLTTVNNYAFGMSAAQVTTSLEKVYFMGDQSAWNTLVGKLSGQSKTLLSDIETLFYSEAATGSATEWHWKENDVIPEAGPWGA